MPSHYPESALAVRLNATVCSDILSRGTRLQPCRQPNPADISSLLPRLQPSRSPQATPRHPNRGRSERRERWRALKLASPPCRVHVDPLIWRTPLTLTVHLVARPRHPSFSPFVLPPHTTVATVDLSFPNLAPGPRGIAAREAARLGRIEQLAVLKDFDDGKGVLFKVRFPGSQKRPHRSYDCRTEWWRAGRERVAPRSMPPSR